MKSSLLRILGLSLAFGCSSAYATLIGDTVTVAAHYPTLGTVYSSQNVVVQAGTGDTVTLSGYPAVGINPEANSILFGLSTAGFISASFNGFVVSGIDDTITGFSVTTNIAGWSDARVTFDAHSVAINFQSLNIGTQSNVTLNLNLTPATATPDGGATAAMLGLAVLGLAALSRRVA